MISHPAESAKVAVGILAARSERFLTEPPPSTARGICTVKHEFSCCGCASHPEGHPMGRNHEEWMTHLDAHVSTTS